MKLLLTLYMIVLVAAAPPPSINNTQDNVSLLKSNFKNDGLGTYKYSYEQSDGTKQDQEGELKNKDTDDEYLFVKGSFTWVGPDGVTYTIKYVVDKEGYQPEIEQGPGGVIPPDVASSIIG